jgi:hypothetical protein
MDSIALSTTQRELALHLAAKAGEIAAEVSALDVGAAEEAGADEMRMIVTARATALVGEAVTLLSAAIETFDDESGAAQPISDVAAIARMTLREKEKLLLRLDPESDSWEIVDRCDRALRAVSKAVVALEQALATACGFEPGIEIVDECTRGLRVRTIYAKFRVAVLQIAERDGAIAARIRAAATALAILTGRDEYPLIRVSDRRQLRTLQQRVRRWLADGVADEGDGAHLWQELLAVSSLLLQINRRAELIAHDERVLFDLCGAMRFRGASLESVWPQILSLRGLDLRLDRMLDSPRNHDSAAWAEEICRLAAERRPADSDALAGAHAPPFESQLATRVAADAR